MVDMEFMDVYPEDNRLTKLSIRVNSSGLVSMTAGLKKQLLWDKIVFQISKDLADVSIIRVRRADETEKFFHVTKSGIRAAKLVDLLHERGLSLPASYIMEQKKDYWEGTLEIVPKRTITPKRKRKKVPPLEELV